ncbi:hypothetical protein SESBI_48166 [Sesbania bispinosa]|nr:hypothetical protein SESBI_48166 [Sesbania bispinosa]
MLIKERKRKGSDGCGSGRCCGSRRDCACDEEEAERPWLRLDSARGGLKAAEFESVERKKATARWLQIGTAWWRTGGPALARRRRGRIAATGTETAADLQALAVVNHTVYDGCKKKRLQKEAAEQPQQRGGAYKDEQCT